MKKSSMLVAAVFASSMLALAGFGCSHNDQSTTTPNQISPNGHEPGEMGTTGVMAPNDGSQKSGPTAPTPTSPTPPTMTTPPSPTPMK